MVRRPFPFLVWGLVCASLATTAGAAVRHELDSGVFSRLTGPNRIGARFKVDRVPLVDGNPESIEVERFEVWAPDAEIILYGANEHVIRRMSPPAVQYYRGRVQGRPDSLVFLASTPTGVEGLVFAAERKFALGAGRARDGKPVLVVAESSAIDDFPADGGFTCEVDGRFVTPTPDRPRLATNAAGGVSANAAPTGTQRSVIHLAVSTDYELYNQADDGPNADTAVDVTTFIGNLIGAVSTIYDRDLFTEVRVVYLGIQSSSSDPFTIEPGSTGTWNGSPGVSLTASHALYEFGDYWHNTPPSAVARTTTALISGKALQSGVAWVRPDNICGADSLCGSCGDTAAVGHWAGRYSYNGGINPPTNLGVPDPNASPGGITYGVPASNYWPLLQVSHEMGHNVGSSHTHCIALDAGEQALYGRTFVDLCVDGGSGCYSGANSVPTEKGTIMSYCHLSGGTSSRFTFGQPGEASVKVLNNMRGYMASVTPALSAITAPASLNAGVSGAASVTNTGLTYTWTITNGTFTGGGTSATGASVTFSGTTNPAVLKVIATNASGCAITDTKSVTINTVVYDPPANVVATALTSTSVQVTWSAVAGATNYHVHRAESQGSYLVEFDAGSSLTYTDITAVAGKSYQYVVRAGVAPTYSVFSDDDVATTVIFTDPSVANAPVKTLHFTELLTAVNAMRTLTGFGTISFTGPAPGAGVAVAKAHVDDLRSGLAPALGALGLASSFTETITAGVTTIQAPHIAELRGKVQ